MSGNEAGARDAYVATAGGFVAILLWSTTVALARHLSEQLGPVTAAAAVYGLSGVIAVFALLRDPRKRKKIRGLPARYLVGCGGLFVGYMLVLYLAVGLADGRQQVLEVGLVNYLWPALTVVLSTVLLPKRASWSLLPATLLALAGVFLVVTHRGPTSFGALVRNLSHNPAAYSLALAAALAWATYSNLTRRWAGGRAEGGVMVFLPVTAVVLLVSCGFIDEPRAWTWRAGAETLFLGVATCVAYALWDHAMRRGNMLMVAAGSYLTPFFSTVVSCLYLAVAPGAGLWVGCAAIILGSVLSWLSVSEPTG
jgi:drug/metabolite transporter (DMT)-like permease